MAELHQYEELALGLAVLQGPLGQFLLDPLDGPGPSATECPGRQVDVRRDGSLWPDAAIHLMEGRVPLLDHRVVEYCRWAPVAWLCGRLDGLLGRAPNVLGRATVMALIGEQQTDGTANVNRLLAVMSVLPYTADNGLTLIG